MPSTRIAVERSTGVLRLPGGGTISQPYVLTHTGNELVGAVVARDPAKGMVLYRVQQPARSTESIVGLYPEPVSPWSNGHPVWTRYQCTGGTLRVTVSSDRNLFAGTIQTLAVSGTTPARSIPVPRTTDHRVLRFPLHPRGGVCRVAFTITPTRAPASWEKGSSDTRQLGLHFDRVRYIAPT